MSLSPCLLGASSRSLSYFEFFWWVFLSLFTDLPPGPPSQLPPAPRAVQQAPRWLPHDFLPLSSADTPPPTPRNFASRRGTAHGEAGCPREGSGAHAWRLVPSTGGGDSPGSPHGTGGRCPLAGPGARAAGKAPRPGEGGPAASELPPGALPPPAFGWKLRK